MLRYIRKEAIALVILLLVASFIIFTIVYIAPGDPLSTLLGTATPTPERVAQLSRQYNLDQPFLMQYWLWISHALQGDFGTSIQYQEPVSELLIGGLRVSIPLIIYAETLIILIGVGAAIVASRFEGWPDHAVSLATAVGVAIPTFVAAVVLSIVFTVQFGWFPATGSGEGVFGMFYHLTLPAFALAIVSWALIARVGRTSMREEAASQHVTTEVARGVPSGRVFHRHVMRNAAPPMLAVIGLQIPALIAGTVVVELAFNLGGVGSLLLGAVNSHDFPVVQAIALLIVFVTVVVGVIVEILHARLDPRIRVGERT